MRCHSSQGIKKRKDSRYEHHPRMLFIQRRLNIRSTAHFLYRMCSTHRERQIVSIFRSMKLRCFFSTSIFVCPAGLFLAVQLCICLCPACMCVERTVHYTDKDILPARTVRISFMNHSCCLKKQCKNLFITWRAREEKLVHADTQIFSSFSQSSYIIAVLSFCAQPCITALNHVLAWIYVHVCDETLLGCSTWISRCSRIFTHLLYMAFKGI